MTYCSHFLDADKSVDFAYVLPVFDLVEKRQTTSKQTNRRKKSRKKAGRQASKEEHSIEQTSKQPSTRPTLPRPPPPAKKQQKEGAAPEGIWGRTRGAWAPS